jgi:hypothetical protein
MPNPPTNETTAPTPKSKTPPKAATRKPRLDPEIVKLRKKHATEVAEYLRKRSSAALLKTIVDKRLPKLVPADREKLLDVLMANTTRCFPNMLKREDVLADAGEATPKEEQHDPMTS